MVPGFLYCTTTRRIGMSPTRTEAATRKSPRYKWSKISN